MEYVVKSDEVKVNVLDMLTQAEEVGKSQDKIPVFLIPTVYGTGALIHCSAENTLVHEKDSALRVDIQSNSLIYDEEKAHDAEWFLFVYKGVLHRDKVWRKYILPFDMEDIHEDGAIKAIFFSEEEMRRGNAYSIYYETDLCLPDIRWKVTKPGMRCKDMHYELGKYFPYRNELQLHSSGYHFANDPHALLTWYRHFSLSNEVYLVQIPGHKDGKHKVILDEKSQIGVTDGILFLNKISWEEILPQT